MSSISNDFRGKVWRALFIALWLIAFTPAGAHAQADYRTVVIFGDTQTLVNGDPDNSADFAAMIDWVIANKYAENIDFILHVGDIINIGSFLPLPPVCSGQPVETLGQCLSAPSCSPPPPGCYPMDNGSGQTDCLSCSFSMLVSAEEWQRFTAEWSRLEPDPASGWSGIPYAIVRGNHDNVGTDLPSEFDIPGYNQYYGEAEMEALEVAFAGSDRLYEHIETYPYEDQDGHAWRFQIGSRQILVVGPSYEGGVGTSQQQINWVTDVFGRHPNLPGLLVIHDMMQHSQVYNQVVQQVGTAAPNLFLTAQGHVQQDLKWIDTFDGIDIARTVSDWSRTPSPGGSFLALVRFYFEPGQPDEIEAFTYSPVTDTTITDADKTIVKQPLAVPEPSAWSIQLTALCGALLLGLRARPAPRDR